MLPPSRGRLNTGAFAPSAKGGAGTDRGTADAAGFSAGGLLGPGCLSADFSAGGLLGAGCLTADFSAKGLLGTGRPTAGFAAAFDTLMVLEADFPGLDDFNFFDGALCEAFAVALPVCLFFVLLVLAAVAPRVFEGAVFADLADLARGALEGLEDFFRVFLDIRLPFVAFRGSIIELSRQVGIEQTVRRV